MTAELQVLERDNQRVLTTQQLAEAYGTDTITLQQNFNNNKGRYHEGKHYYLLKGEELRGFKRDLENFEVAANVNKLYLWTEKGTLLHAKSLNTDTAWEVYDRLVETYFRYQEQTQQVEQLSPQLQLLINMELRQNEIENRQKMADQRQKVTEQRLDDIVNIVALNPTQWRKDTSELINKMALACGGFEHIRGIREEIYRLLEQRYGVKLGTRLTNKRKVLALNGVVKSRIDRVSQLDVIADDKKLIEGYIAIVKEMAIKHGIASPDKAS